MPAGGSSSAGVGASSCIFSDREASFVLQLGICYNCMTLRCTSIEWVLTQLPCSRQLENKTLIKSSVLASLAELQDVSYGKSHSNGVSRTDWKCHGRPRPSWHHLIEWKYFSKRRTQSFKNMQVRRILLWHGVAETQSRNRNLERRFSRRSPNLWRKWRERSFPRPLCNASAHFPLCGHKVYGIWACSSSKY